MGGPTCKPCAGPGELCGEGWRQPLGDSAFLHGSSQWLSPPFPDVQCPVLASSDTAHMVHLHICTQNTHTLNIKKTNYFCKVFMRLTGYPEWHFDLITVSGLKISQYIYIIFMVPFKNKHPILGRRKHFESPNFWRCESRLSVNNSVMLLTRGMFRGPLLDHTLTYLQ